MLVITEPISAAVRSFPVTKSRRIELIDLLRGIVMIIMAIDHARDYFHADAFIYSPTDLAHTNVPLFLTRLITHYCAPVFVLLAGVSAHLYGAKRNRNELSVFLFTRGLWLIFAECCIITFSQTFNPSYPIFNLQVIWAIGVCMVVLSAIVRMKFSLILLTGILLVSGHNLLDNVHVQGTGVASVVWSLLHDPGKFTFGHSTFNVIYPVLPWIGIMALGYCLGSLYATNYPVARRRRTLYYSGSAALLLFVILRSGNFYGDALHWEPQRNLTFTLLSFVNVTKYPPSLLYILMTLGPALIFLALVEKPLNKLTSGLVIFGRVPMFYYVLHIFMIHLFALIAATLSGYHWYDMILSHRVNSTPVLKGYGFSLMVVYTIWLVVILVLYPLCKWFDAYKRANQAKYWWLSYI